MAKKHHGSTPVVVGIGSSAGGLAALKDLLPTLPKGENFSYVLVQHMDPSHPSMLVDILAKVTPLPVNIVSDKDSIEADTIYVVPAGESCQLVDKQLRLIDIDTELGPRHTIDVLFASIAETCKDKAVGIVLSGTGSDGLQGTHAIKAAGGISIVQDPATAEYPGMPRAVIHDVLADLILPASDMGTALIDIFSRPTKVDTTPTPSISLKSLARLLTSKTGFDFTQYKETTLMRRVERRMTVNKIQGIEDYAAFLRESDIEANLLLKDILISVTGFFRDQPTFDAIAALLPSMVEKKTAGDTIRVWVAGCATGEEAFSIAILLAEALGDKLNTIKVQIFATDFDTGAISVARRSVYLPNAIQQVPNSLLEKYFTRTEGAYQVNRQIRDMVVFAKHDLMQDPPFTRLDLVSCRNVLIYFKRLLQEQLIATFHYILNPGGYLILGSSESLGKYTELFEQTEKTLRVFERRDVDQIPLALLKPPYFAARQQPLDVSTPRPRSYEQSFEHMLLERYTPVGVLVNNRAEIVYVKGDVSRFIQLQPGEYNVNLAEMAISPLRLDIRLTLQMAQRENTIVRSKAIVLPPSFGGDRITVVAIPAGDNGDLASLTALLFEETPVLETGQNGSPADSSSADFRNRELEQELTATREHLQSMIEQLETSNEELQSINEEYQSTTEELQSSNEEFQTTNEELQSTNEELSTVNDELTAKTQELTLTNTEMETLLNVAIHGIIVLDADIRVSRYSASSQQLFDLMPTSIGKPLIAVGGPFDLAFLSGDIQCAIQSLKPVERELDLGERRYLVRLIPMIEQSSEVTGLVVTFTDETERLLAAADAQRLAAVLKDSKDAIALLDLDGSIRSWNAGAARLYGYTEAEALTMNLTDLVPIERRDHALDFIDEIKSGESVEAIDTQRLTKDGRIIDIWLTVTVLNDENNKPVSVATTERDVTERTRKSAEQRAAELAHLHRLNTLGEMASGIAHEVNQPLAAITQLSDAALALGRSRQPVDEELMGVLQNVHDQTLRAGDVIHHLRQLVRKSDPDRDCIDVNSLIRETVEFIRSQAHDNGITIELQLAENLPDMIVDKVQISQVVLNLLRNSIEAMDKSVNKPLRITVATRLTTEGGVQISVKDTGPGLDVERIRDIFQPFHSTKPLGLGMGLSISRSIIEAHGGRVWADVDANDGASFHFTIPVTVG